MSNGGTEYLETVMWGERGLVATFFQDLSKGGNFERWNAFAHAISLTTEGLTHAWTVIEPDFGQFGKPDAISLLIAGDKPFVLITEAKRCPYRRAARHQSTRAFPGFNSSINGQLELNHRLTLALAEYTPEIERSLREPDWILDTAYLTKHPGIPAYLMNETVLRRIVELGQLFGLHATDYHHLFITTDAQDPRIHRIDADLQPKLFIEGPTAIPFEQPKFLWKNWSDLGELFGDGPAVLCPPHFPPTYQLNAPNLVLPRPVDEPQQGWGSSGVALIRLTDQLDGLPTVPTSHVHLSWRRGTAVLRDYSSQQYREGPYRALVDVIPFVVGEPIRYAAHERQPYTNIPWWRQEIANQNHIRPLP